MLQAHSLLWNYLWIAPNVLLLVLGLTLWKRGLQRQFPAFFAFAVLSSLADLAVFTADVLPGISAENFWRVDWACLLTESLLKFVVVGEVFSRLLNPFPSLARLGRNMVSGFGAALLLAATLAAALSRGGSQVRIVAAFHLLSQAVFIIELGLIVFVFLFAAYFQLAWDRRSFGVLLGFGISSCVYLTCWAISANTDPKGPWRSTLDFIDMATYHACVLLWFYYLLVPKKASATETAPRIPETNLELWNRELERLLQQ